MIEAVIITLVTLIKMNKCGEIDENKNSYE